MKRLHAVAASLLLAGSSLGLAACSGGAESSVVAGEGDHMIDVLTLDGSETFAFDADPRLAMAEQSTIEFWVLADWSEDPGFDPVVLSNPGPEGVSYMIGMTAERDGLIIVSGDTIEAVPFDFADGQMHHVALVDYNSELSVQIDHQAIANLPITFEAFPSDGLFVGSGEGGEDGFIGKIGGLRIWDVAVEPEVLARFSRRAVVGDSGHPDASELKLVSDFADKQIVYAQ